MAERDTQVEGTTMPELLVDFITSLDGYGAAEGWPGWWELQGPEYMAWLGERPEANYTVLMARTPTASCRDWQPKVSPARMRSLACRTSSSRPP
jgi:hypothetical protein